jgi:hypothetical protein
VAPQRKKIGHHWYIVNDKVVERFWGFLKPKEYNSEVLAECIKEQLAQHIGDVTSKLIAQTYMMALQL